MKINFKTLTQKVVPMLVRSIYKILENLYNICYIKLYKLSVSHFHYIKASSFNAISNKARQYYRTQIFNFYASGRRPFLMLFWCIQKILEWRLYRKISPRSNMSRFNSHTINQIIEMVALQIVISFPVMKTNFILINIKMANNTLIIIRRLIYLLLLGIIMLIWIAGNIVLQLVWCISEASWYHARVLFHLHKYKNSVLHHFSIFHTMRTIWKWKDIKLI